MTTNIVPHDILCHDYPSLANHEPIQLQRILVLFPVFKCVNGHANAITSVEHNVDGNVRTCNLAVTVYKYSRQTVHIYLYVK